MDEIILTIKSLEAAAAVRELTDWDKGYLAGLKRVVDEINL